MGRQLKITHNLDPDDIYVRAVCQETKKSFRFNLDIEVYVTYKWGSPEEIKDFEVQLDED